MVQTQDNKDNILELNRVEKHICNFFKSKGIFHSQYHGFPSYDEVRGKNFVEIPDGISISNKVWPVDNEKSKDISNAVHECEKLGRTLFVKDKSQDLEVLSRHFMIYGSTLPIRVGYRIGAPKAKHTKKTKDFVKDALYVKQMNLSRIFLGTLYHLMVGRDYAMAFSESSIVQEETKGPTILEAYQKDHTFLNDSKIKRELVRLGVVAYFLSLYDMDNGANVVLDHKKRFDVIDFDKAFWDRIPDPREELVNPFTYQIGNKKVKEIFDLPYDKLMRHFGKGEVESLAREEMDKVYYNIKENLDLFHGIIESMAYVEYYNQSVRKIYGEKDIVSYFLRRYHDFKPKG